ncbi:MAG: DcrB-related protein [bacterium]|nr:DcrB-related protein [bacterium]
MAKIDLAGLEVVIPDSWQVQGMVTLTLPSPDPKVKPNIILTREKLPQPMALADYFEKIKEAISKRGIKDFKILEEQSIKINGEPAMSMVCIWDVAAMKAMMKAPGAPKNPPTNPPEPQLVKQVQITLLRNETIAINLTASFPADQFDVYYRPFQKFVKDLKFTDNGGEAA